jgi:signal peptidase I
MTMVNDITTSGGRAAQPRSPWIAALLALLMPGLGHMYIGQARRGMVLFGLIAGASVLYVLAHFATPRFWMIIVPGAMVLALFLFAVIDPARQARHIDAFRPHSYNKWYLYAGAAVLGWAVFTIPSIYLPDASPPAQLRIFYASAPSMEPLIRQGERFLVDTTYYHAHAPSRGDVVVYMQPKQPGLDYVKRIAAVGGDRIAVTNGRAIVNGTPVSEPFIDAGDPSSRYNNTPETLVPDGYVFVLGDNRANSEDSRVTTTHGPVPVENIVGLVTDIAWSRDLTRIGQWAGTPTTP